jgi:hypothetical protein
VHGEEFAPELGIETVVSLILSGSTIKWAFDGERPRKKMVFLEIEKLRVEDRR